MNHVSYQSFKIKIFVLFNIFQKLINNKVLYFILNNIYDELE
jgi:hypothetical protein